MNSKTLLTLGLVLALGALGGLATGCDDESDYCRAYCEMAADCLDCGGAGADIKKCENECVDLSFSEQKALSNCAKDCGNVLACRQIAGFIPPTPCEY